MIWEGEELASFTGAERLVRLHVERVMRRPAVLPLRFGFREYSPVLADTGAWPAR